MSDVVRLTTRAAASDAVLITGEAGVGKDPSRETSTCAPGARTRPFIAVNCAGFTETLLESELFGHVKGSFTGAYRDKPGKLQLAHRGTLFLDEVGEMSLRMQALLLRFLENGESAVRGRRPRADEGGRARDRRHEPCPRGHGHERPVPRRPAVPAARHSHPRAAAARAARRHPSARAVPGVEVRARGGVQRGCAARCSNATGGPATCASCRTSSSSRCGCRTAAAWRSRTCRRRCRPRVTRLRPCASVAAR